MEPLISSIKTTAERSIVSPYDKLQNRWDEDEDAGLSRPPGRKRLPGQTVHQGLAQIQVEGIPKLVRAGSPPEQT